MALLTKSVFAEAEPMIAAQLIIYLLVFTLMVKIAVRGNALNGIYFYPREVQKRAVEIGLIDETMMSIKRLVSAQMLIRAFLYDDLQLPALGLLADGGKALVEAILCDQFLVRAAFSDAAVVHHKNLVSVPDGGQSVGNGDNRLAVSQLGDRLLDEMLILRVDSGRGLVQNDDGRVLENGSGDEDCLQKTIEFLTHEENVIRIAHRLKSVRSAD